MISSEKLMVIRSFGEINQTTVDRSVLACKSKSPTDLLILPLGGARKIVINPSAFLRSLGFNRKTYREEVKHINSILIPKGIEIELEGENSFPPNIDTLSLVRVDDVFNTDNIEIISTLSVNKELKVSSVNTLGLKVKEGGKIVKKDLIIHQVKKFR